MICEQMRLLVCGIVTKAPKAFVSAGPQGIYLGGKDECAGLAVKSIGQFDEFLIFIYINWLVS